MPVPRELLPLPVGGPGAHSARPQGVSHSVRSRLRRTVFRQDWGNEICQAVNSFYSVNAEPKELHHPSQAQTDAVRHFSEV
eukprot:6561695-Pyramimonas_sp.AAC.1